MSVLQFQLLVAVRINIDLGAISYSSLKGSRGLSTTCPCLKHVALSFLSWLLIADIRQYLDEESLLLWGIILLNRASRSILRVHYSQKFSLEAT